MSVALLRLPLEGAGCMRVDPGSHRTVSVLDQARRGAYDPGFNRMRVTC